MHCCSEKWVGVQGGHQVPELEQPCVFQKTHLVSIHEDHDKAHKPAASAAHGEKSETPPPPLHKIPKDISCELIQPYSSTIQYSIGHLLYTTRYTRYESY